MEINFTKKDFWLAILAGELVAWLSLPTLKNLKLFDFLSSQEISFMPFVIFWVIFVPLGAILALSVFYLIAKNRNSIGFFQAGKYGITGTLNTFLYAGIYNFLIYITNIASGLQIDIFAVIAFVLAVTNSFFWNKYWSFEGQGGEFIKTEAIKFFIVSSLVAIINISIIHIIVNVIGAPSGFDSKIWANVALIFAIIVAFFGNFFSYKFIVFSAQDESVSSTIE